LFLKKVIIKISKHTENDEEVREFIELMDNMVSKFKNIQIKKLKYMMIYRSTLLIREGSRSTA